ncbi:MAG: TIGR04282 family arsenosugar biosynthesis glycosyltransferase [Burkholderiales bacterium]
MTTLLVFAKAPVAGAVKTRLAATVGPERALAVYRALLDTTLACADAARAAGVVRRVELWGTPEGDATALDVLSARHGFTRHAQQGADLGARMAHALAATLQGAPRALLAGTDCPVLTPEYLALAAAALDAHDAVLGPAEDGGYVLVGARRPVTFAGVRWSTPHACADTRAAFAAQHATCALLPPLWDVDDAAGLARWQHLAEGAGA